MEFDDKVIKKNIDCSSFYFFGDNDDNDRGKAVNSE